MRGEPPRATTGWRYPAIRGAAGTCGRVADCRASALESPLRVDAVVVAIEELMKESMLRYMLLIYGAENAWSPAERDACYVESAQLAQSLHAEGKYHAANPLHSVSSAASVKVREGKATVTDGPFAETREQLGGYFLIEADSLEEATAIAARIPGAKVGTVEVRPVLDVGGLPEM